MSYADHGFDGQPDYYLLEIPGFSGKFLFNNEGDIVTIPLSNLKISYTRLKDPTQCYDGEYNPITSFTVIDDKGIKYYFGSSGVETIQSEKSKNSLFKETVSFNIDPEQVYADVTNFQEKIITWKITKIKPPSSDSEIDFTYTTRSEFSLSGTNEEYFRSDPLSTCTELDYYLHNEVWRTVETKKLEKIQWETGYALFVERNNERQDLCSSTGEQGFALQNIEVYNISDTKVVDIQFDNDQYFLGIDQTINLEMHLLKRLKLGSLQINNEKYNFEYNELTLPAKNSKNIDLFGFYKVADTNSSKIKTYIYFSNENQLPFLSIYSPWHLGTTPDFVLPGVDRTPDSLSITAASLVKVIYPTGGSNEFIYERNRFRINGVNKDFIGPGIRIKNIKEKDETKILSEKELSYASLSNPSISSGRMSYPFYFAKKSSIPSDEIPQNSCGANEPLDLCRQIWNTTRYSNSQLNYGASEGNSLGYSDVIVKDVQDNGYIQLSFENSIIPEERMDKPSYTILAQLNGNYPGYTPLDPPYEYKSEMFPFKPGPDYQWTRGKLKSTSYYTGSNLLIKKIENFYETDEPYSPVYEFYASFFQVERRNWILIMNINGQPVNAIDIDLSNWDIRWDLREIPLGLKRLTYTITHDYNQYGEVITRTDYTYNPYNYVQTVQSTNSDGLVILEKYRYVSDMDISQITSNCYQPYQECLHEANNDYMDCFHTCKDQNFPAGCLESCEDQFEQETDQCLTEYNNCISISTLPPGLGAIINMRLIGMNSYPIEYQKLVNDKLIGGKYTEYIKLSNGLIRPSKEYRIQSANPISNSQLVYIDTQNNLVIDNNYNVTRNFDIYDAHGKLLEYHDENQEPVSILWGYSNTLPVAEVFNAEQGELFYESFETASNYSNDAHTGEYSKEVIPNNFTGVIDFNRSALLGGVHKYSAWIKTEGTAWLIVKNFDNGNSTPYLFSEMSSTNGKWKYVELDFDVSDPDWSTCSIVRCEIWNQGSTENIYVDDIRLVPSDAKMITKTYKPLVGTTSISDENNLPEYFEYDAQNRLKLAKDHNRSIKDMYNYYLRNH